MLTKRLLVDTLLARPDNFSLKTRGVRQRLRMWASNQEADQRAGAFATGTLGHFCHGRVVLFFKEKIVPLPLRTPTGTIVGHRKFDTPAGAFPKYEHLMRGSSVLHRCSLDSVDISLRFRLLLTLYISRGYHLERIT